VQDQDVSVFVSFQTVPGAHLAFRSVFARVSFPQGKLLEYKADHSSRSRAQVRCQWRYISTPPYAIMTCTLLQTRSVVGPDTFPSVQVVTPSVLSSIPFHLFYFRCLCSTESVQTEAFFALSDQFLLIVKGPLVGCTQLLIPDVQTPYKSGGRLLHYLRVC
jgi:hypothetical protein